MVSTTGQIVSPEPSRNNRGRPELIDHILVSRAVIGSPEAITVRAITDAPMPDCRPDGSEH